MQPEASSSCLLLDEIQTMAAWRPPPALPPSGSESVSPAASGRNPKAKHGEPATQRARRATAQEEGDTLNLDGEDPIESTQDKKHKKGGGKGSKKKGDKKLTVRDGGLKAMLELMGKQILINAQIARDICSILFAVIIMKIDCDIIKAMQQEGKNYSQAVRAAGKGHQLGPPGPAIFCSMIEALCKADVGAANRTALETVRDKLATAEQKAILEDVPFIKLGKCYDEGTIKILLHMRDRTTGKMVTDALAQLGGKICLGKAPAGHIERELSEWLTAVQSS